MKKEPTEELDFVLRHYREDAFSPEEAMKKMSPPAEHHRQRWRWVAVAASVAALSVFAGALVWPSAGDEPSQPAPTTEVVQQPAQSAAEASFRFDDTPLPQVLQELGSYYGVTLTATDTTRHLTGSFAGEQLDDILAMIEEVLQVKISRNGN